MRRRICLAGAALSVACPLALGAAGASAASKSKPAPLKTRTQRVRCTTSTSIVIPPGETTVLPPASQGREYGTSNCAPGLGAGVQKDAFAVVASGDTEARYTLYFPSGTMHGTYVLIPQEESLNFLAADSTGTMKVLGGSGAYKGVKGTGTMVCKSGDGLHTTCTDRLKLSNLP